MSKILRWGRAHKYSIYQILRVLTAGMMILFAVTGCKTDVGRVDLTGITVTPPSKLTYNVGEELNTEGMVVTATYSDETTKDVTAEVTISGFDSSTAADSKTITVTYGGKTATFTVKIIELTKIEITNQPTKKDYHIGDTLDTTGMVVTANYNDGSTKTLEPTEYTVTGFDSTDFVNEQLITVTHNDKTDTFTINVLFSWLETPVQLPAGTNGTYGTKGTYVLFGVWPQDVVPVDDEEALALNETAATTIERGYLKYVKGSDGNYYVKCNEKRYGLNLKYTKDGSAVGAGSRWFKVMPIKWRVADPAYVVDGTNGSSTAKLLVAENILTANVPYYDYGKLDRTRTVGTKNGIYHNNYEFSQIRAYLNGLDYYYDTNNGTPIKTTYTNKGFLQTAFTSDAIDSIILTKVDNSGESTTDVTGAIQKATTYACDPTEDKIFLLSEYEVTKYSTEAYNIRGAGNSRIRVTTDFAKANYANLSTTNGYGGYYWLRSPYYKDNESYYARFVSYDGDASNHYDISFKWVGVVPALAISF